MSIDAHTTNTDTGTGAGADAVPSLDIRTKPPSPKRLSRKVLLSACLSAGAIIAFALVNGLSERDRTRDENQNAVQAASGPPENIAQASADYDASTMDYGRYDLANADTLQPPDDPLWTNGETEAEPSPTEVRAPNDRTEVAPDPQQMARAAPILFARDAEAGRGEDDEVTLNARLTPPRARTTLQAGHVIPAALISGLNSDLPGQVSAQVTAPVFDSITGEHLLIPQGSRLIGRYDNAVRYGDRRLFLVWTRLILPNGWSINLEEMAASDPSGAAGLTDRTDHHFGRLGVAIGLSAIISVIANESEDEDEEGSLSQSVGDAAAQQAAQSGGRIVDRELNVRPSLTIRPGASVRVLVTRDLVLRAYR
ncbi:MAG: TrbI/VirB10 family protein [Hyphomonadaceae bacterium JAD_PAG50586_4]|nr:MAG: TrbI/VirB10 family protein [Hyphomonadaceae bacterium JAD_PAG50586_4]